MSTHFQVSLQYALNKMVLKNIYICTDSLLENKAKKQIIKQTKLQQGKLKSPVFPSL